jgi:hypothetical protein
MGAREGMSPRLLYRNPLCRRSFWLALPFFLSLLIQPARGQDSTPASATEKPPPATPQDSAPKPKQETGSEISQIDSAATFKVRVNLVQVRVIVRDSSGKPIDNLTRQDFLLYDQGCKPSAISPWKRFRPACSEPRPLRKPRKTLR